METQHVGGLLLHRESTAAEGHPECLFLCHFMSLLMPVLSVRLPGTSTAGELRYLLIRSQDCD